MILLWLPVGLALPTISGWLLIRLIESRHPVLLRTERWILGFLFGTTGTMFLTFLLHIAGLISFTRFGFAAVQIIVTSLLGILRHLQRKNAGSVAMEPLPSEPPFSQRMRILLGIAGAWMGAKILAGFLMLTTTPVYFDDVFNNWNMRGKIFFWEKKLSLIFQTGNEQVATGGTHSYPPTIPMVKAWLAALAGQWNEGLANAAHILWYLAALGLVYYFLRRTVSRLAALLGAYLLGSIPLFLVHGSNPYADVFIAAHIFAAVGLLASAALAKEPAHRLTFFRLATVGCALLIFTKNEGLVLHLPPLLILAGFSLLWMRCRGLLAGREVLRSGCWFIGCLAVVGIPWLAFKWIHHLPFGNAKALSGLTFAWQENVLYAIGVNTFFEGNWLFLYPFLLALMIACWKKAFRTPAVIFTAFFLIVYLGQLPLFLFTGLSTEAIMQTGYARGLLQLAPVAVTLLTILAEDLIKRQKILKEWFTPR